jgi:hypothetical protein
VTLTSSWPRQLLPPKWVSWIDLLAATSTAFEFVEPGRTYGFDADGGLLRLASEAYLIRLAYGCGVVSMSAPKQTLAYR